MSKTPGSRRSTPADRDKYLKLRLKGWSAEQAARQIGFSKSWGYQLERRGGVVVPDQRHSKVARELEPPEPKTWDQLDGGVRDTLKDFLLFRRVFLVRDELPWARDAAARAVESILDKSQRDFWSVQMPPGSGKTTLWTHDLVLWLLAGGGSEDPAFGRALRFLLGSNSKHVSVHYVTRVRNALELRRPHYDKDSKRSAEMTLTEAFGRFKPRATIGEDAMWRRDQFMVAQVGGKESYEKEPTVQAASRESGFLGERFEAALWDDLCNYQNSRSIEQAESLATWFSDEAETRVEPGGALFLVGQRLGPLDLYRNRLDATYTDEDGHEENIYQQVVFPAHNDETCENGGIGKGCKQWDGGDDGCLLDAHRLPVKDLLRAQARDNFETVMQQRDSNPGDVLIDSVWLTGGIDPKGYVAPGCYDRDRGFNEWPKGRYLVDYVTIDPSVSGFWAVLWWALDPQTGRRYLIRGLRKKMKPGDVLDLDPTTGRSVGLMQEWQEESGLLGHPIRLWCLEQNAAHAYLLQTNAYRVWSQRWPNVEVVRHVTKANKNSEQFGVFALLPMAFKTGMVRLPGRRDDPERLRFLLPYTKELTTYPHARTDDAVMATWFSEFYQKRIQRIADEDKDRGSMDFADLGPRAPRHLLRQQGIMGPPRPSTTIYGRSGTFHSRGG